MSEERVRVLLVDDEASLRIPLTRYLEGNYGFQVSAAADCAGAMHLAEENQGQFDVALIDEVLQLDTESPSDKTDGIHLMQQLKARYPDVETIIFTGWGRESRQRAIQAGAFRYVEKPFDHGELAMVIRLAAQQVRLRTISREILSEKDPDRVLHSIMVAACFLAVADDAAIVLLDQLNDRLRVHTRTPPEERQWRRHFTTGSLSREIVHRGQVVRVPDTGADPRVDPGVPGAGISAFLGLPIPGEVGNLGALYVYSRRPGSFEEWGTVAVAWMGMASSTWRHAIDKHALTIREQVQLLGRDWQSIASVPRDSKIPDRIETIERLATLILERPITAPLSSEEGVDSVPLNSLVEERAQQLWQNDPYRKATLRTDFCLADEATVRASPEWLRRAFDLLVDNAVKALTGRTHGQVTIGTRAADGGAEIQVSDTGPGISEEIQAKIGLDAIERPEDATGLGMGLLMAQTIVQTYSGEIRCATSGATGTTMVIWLPLEERAS